MHSSNVDSPRMNGKSSFAPSEDIAGSSSSKFWVSSSRASSTRPLLSWISTRCSTLWYNSSLGQSMPIINTSKSSFPLESVDFESGLFLPVFRLISSARMTYLMLFGWIFSAAFGSSFARRL